MEIERVATGVTDLDIAGLLAELLHRWGKVEGDAVLLDADEYYDTHILVLQTRKVCRLDDFVIDQDDVQGRCVQGCWSVCGSRPD
nr:hypothetical protein [Lamprobacter modestohalophilus]